MKRKSHNQPAPLTPLRIFFAILGGLILTVAGGCTIILGLPGLAYGEWQAVLLYGGVPIASGASVLWLALRWRRGENDGAPEMMGNPND
ncbi:MAG: hypothetical protein IMF08_02885 [Proteobacteria bacterium]|nr:hypothetical protein [Pseudomonadota bacterium]